MTVMSFKELLQTVVITVCFGGNALINVGPMKEGVIPSIFRKRLLQLGEWLKVNGEAIYGTSPWHYQQDSINPDIWYTCKKETYDPMCVADVPRHSDRIISVYAIFFKWPKNGVLKFKFEYPNTNTDFNIYLLKAGYLGVEKIMLDYSTFNGSVTVVNLPSAVNSSKIQAWVLKIAY